MTMMRFDVLKKPVVLWILVVLMAVPTLAQRRPSDLSAEAARQIDELYAAARVDSWGRLGIAEYEPALLDEILHHLEKPDLRVPALHLLRLALRQWQMPTEALTAIEKKLRPIQEKELVRDYVIPIQWQIRLLRAEPGERLSLAKEGLRSGSESIWSWAAEFLVKVGGEEAKQFLREAQQWRESQKLNEHANRIRLAIKRIEVNEEIARRGNGDQLEYVWTMFEEYVKQKPGWGTFEFVLWLMEKIEGIGTPDALWRLKQFYEDKGNDRDYRYAAQEALVRKGQLLPSQRQIITIHEMRGR